MRSCKAQWDWFFFWGRTIYTNYNESVGSALEGTWSNMFDLVQQDATRTRVIHFPIQSENFHLQCFRGTGAALCTLEELTDCAAHWRTKISGTNPLALPTLLKICVLANSENTHKSIFIESMFNNEYAISLEKPLKTFTAFLLYEEHFSLQLVAGACNRNCKATNAENSSPHQNLDGVT